MAVNLAALAVVNPALSASLDTRLPHMARVQRATNAAPDTSDAALGYGTPSAPAPLPEPVGPFPCEFGPVSNRDGRMLSAGDGKQTAQPWQVVFRASDGAQIKTRDLLLIGAHTFSVLIPPPVGSFDTLVAALCQEVLL